MGKSRGRRAIERGLVDMSSPTAATGYECDRASCSLETFCIDLFDQGRVMVWQWYDAERRIADFVMVQQVNVSGAGDADEVWEEVVRLDCSHSEVHVHYFNAGGKETSRRVLQELKSRADVDIGLDLAEDVVYEHWEQNLGRWQSAQ